MTEHKHIFDKDKRIPSKPWAGLRGVTVRKCTGCDRVEEFSNGRDGFHGWFEASKYAKSMADKYLEELDK